MDINRKSCALSFQDEVFNELYYMNTLINVTKNACQEREFKGEYYGIPKDFVKNISDERNEYISLLSLASDKLKNTLTLNLSLEKELTLNKNTNYCRR